MFTQFNKNLTNKSLQRQRAEACFPQNLYRVKVIPAGHLSYLEVTNIFYGSVMGQIDAKG